LAVTDASGVFEFPVEEGISEIVLEAPSRAKRRLHLSSAETAASMGDVFLAVAGSLVVEVRFADSVQDSVQEPLEAILIDPANKRETVARLEVDEDTSTARIDGVEPGSYSLVLRGPQPLQRLATDVEVRSGEVTEREIAIRPALIRIRTLLGDEPLPRASVGLRHAEGGWKNTVTTDGDGIYDGPIWQLGSFLTTVMTDTLASPYVSVRDVVANNSVLELVVPARTVAGRVREKSSGDPVRGATVALHSTAAAMSSSLRTETDAKGEYRFTAVRPGLHTIEASAPGYLRSGAIEFVLAETDERIEQSIDLDRGISVPVHVTDRMNAPIHNARVTLLVDGIRVAESVTDNSGLAYVSLPPGRPAIVFVFPQQGSFGSARLPVYDGSDEPQRRTIVVPPAEASLTISVRDTSGNPIEDVRYLIRFAGEFLPPSVLGRTALSESSSASGDVLLRLLPVGYYEVWPYRADSEAATIMAADGEAPIRLGLHIGPGSNRATFELRRSKP
jgi:hypothetical protein